MKKYITFLLLITGICLIGSAQSLERQVISATGSYSTSSNLQLSSTVGEPVIETLINGSITLTQGFQQPDRNGNVGIEDLGVVLDYQIFPNPTTGKLFITLESSKALTISLSLTDLNGRQLGIEIPDLKVAGTAREEMDLSVLANGQYLLHLIDAQHQLQKTFKILKME